MIIKDIPIIETAAGVMILTVIIVFCCLYVARKVLEERWKDEAD